MECVVGLGLAQNFWRALLQEDTEARRPGGLTTNKAKQELQVLEDDINYASFILAAGVSNPQPIEDWVTEAQKAAFCLADQIAMYATPQVSSDYGLLYRMKCNIGMMSIAELTAKIRCHKTVGTGEGNKPVVAQQSDIWPPLPEISPFIRYPRDLEREHPKIGMHDKIERVKAFLRGARPVLFITGGQGLGKTTLVRGVYKSEKQKMKAASGPTTQNGHFKKCCWVDVAHTGGLVGLLKKMLKKAEVDSDSIDEFEIMKTVHDTFKGRSYLIVLDNVHDKCVLHSLKRVLQNSKGKIKGKIICLTRSKEIEEDKYQDVIQIHIAELEPYDSFKLLLSAAFPGFDNTVLPRENFNSPARDNVFRDAITWKDHHSSQSLLANELATKVNLLNAILSKCQNNPQNIWSTGTLLEGNPLEKWEEIRNRVDGILIDGTKEYKTRDPPIQLKDATLAHAATRHCFLYCLAFPETSEVVESSRGIPTGKLIRLWAAEGYVQESPRRSQEQEAKYVLDELIDKNLLVVKKKGFDGEVLKCSVNEHIRPLALKMCKYQKFCRFLPDDVDGDEATLPRRMDKCFPVSPNIRVLRRKKISSDRYRMLAVHGDRGVEEASKALGKDTRIRSVLHFEAGRIEHSVLPLSFQRTCMLLRTLDLQGAHIACLPSSIDSLVCLRYLGLRNTQLEDLPLTLEKLSHLMCLDIRDTSIVELADVSGLTEMRHLYLTNSFRSNSVLIKQGLQSLIHLQTLSGAAYGESSVRKSLSMVPFEQEISNLKHITKLSIKKASTPPSTSPPNNSEVLTQKNFFDAINGMDSLHSLTISSDRDGQQTLFDPNHLNIGKNLRKLKLGGPVHIDFSALEPKMQSITYLYLWDSKLTVDILSTLQGLKNLLLLSLLNASTEKKMSCGIKPGSEDLSSNKKMSCGEEGSKFKCYEKLKKLSIISMENLSEFELGPDAMGKLEELVVAKCGRLTSLPSRLHLLRSLREVHLADMDTDFCRQTKEMLKDKVHVLSQV